MAGAVHERLDRARQTVPAVDAAYVVRGRDHTLGGNLLACAIAYRLFVWMLPFSLLLTAGLGFLRSAGREEPAAVADRLGMSGYVASTVTHASQQAQSSRWALLAMGLWGTYTAGAAAAKTFSAVHGIVWGLPVRRPRRTALASAGFTGIFVGILALALGAYAVRRWAPGPGAAVTLGILAVFALAWLGMSLLLPHLDVPWVRLIPGAICGAVGLQALHLFTVYYLADALTSSSELYGGLGAAASVLLWLYLLGRLVVTTAVLNAMLWERSQARAT
jgi:uncharacterized BrkB/YihY/UPF0761 family membrane protein